MPVGNPQSEASVLDPTFEAIRGLVKDGIIPDAALALGPAIVEHVTKEKTKKDYVLNLRIEMSQSGRCEAEMWIEGSFCNVTLKMKPDGDWAIIGYSM